jgi:Ca2+-binding EF-hand superfamily protein
MTRYAPLAGIGLSTLLVMSPAGADEAADWMRLRVGSAIRGEVTWEQVRATVFQQFRMSNPDERGVTPGGIETLRLVQAAQTRAQTLAQILSQDLDGDGRVTRDELTAALGPRARQPIHANGIQLDPSPDQVRQQLEKLVADALAPDLDRNGVITPEEMKRHSDARVSQLRTQLRAEQYVPMFLDGDADGVVSRAEFEAAARREFDEADTNRDGRISTEEAKAFGERLAAVRRAATQREQERLRQAQMEAAVRSCNAEKPAASARIVLLGAYEGKALSNVSIGGDDRETTVANIEVAPGREPLFLVVTSYDAMIWRVWGATERVSGILAISGAGDKATGQPRVGVVGLPRDKVRFGEKAGCINYFTEKEGGAAAKSVETLFGRKPDEVAGIYGIQSIKVPGLQHIAANPEAASTIRLPETGPGAAMWKEMLRFNPAGLANIDPAEVVSPLPARRYRVLPQQAGLAQLLEEGALTVAGTSRSILIEGPNITPVTNPGAFLITRKTTFPAGLNGAHSVRFILARGVPMPDGSPGHSCVIQEDTGKPTESRAGC